MSLSTNRKEVRAVFAHRLIVIGLGLALIGCFAAPTAVGMAATRRPTWSGKFYPASRAELDAMMRRLYAAVERPCGEHGRGRLRALIMPHAGYVYSGVTAAHAARCIALDGYDRVVLMGPDHHVGLHNASLSDASSWRTPLGEVPVGDYRHLAQVWPDLFAFVTASDRKEHSLEVILPFLQTRLSRFELLPIVLGPCDAATMATAFRDLVRQPRTLLVVSADLSHHLPYDVAVRRDRQTIARMLSLDPDWEQDQDNRSCGRYPIGILLTLARRHGWQPVLLHYSNSGDTAGDKSAVVGYAAVAFYGDEPMQDQTDTQRSLTLRQGMALVKLARHTLADRLGQAVAPQAEQDLAALLADPALQSRCGTFVTLKIGERLRGCIGNLSAKTSLVSAIRENALNAAFHDPRFPPLKSSELAAVRIEVSVLTEPTPLTYVDADDLIAKLRPDVDGVIIKKGHASATFLPQVWTQLPQPEAFLSHLCTKAGLSADQWRQTDLSVQTYQVQHFEEHR